MSFWSWDDLQHVVRRTRSQRGTWIYLRTSGVIQRRTVKRSCPSLEVSLTLKNIIELWELWIRTLNRSRSSRRSAKSWKRSQSTWTTLSLMWNQPQSLTHLIFHSTTGSRNKTAKKVSRTNNSKIFIVNKKITALQELVDELMKRKPVT